MTLKLNPESIINNRIIKLSKLKQGIELSANVTATKVETGSALWAAASLIFFMWDSCWLVGIHEAVVKGRRI